MFTPLIRLCTTKSEKPEDKVGKISLSVLPPFVEEEIQIGNRKDTEVQKSGN